jgi:hypothetical protein
VLIRRYRHCLIVSLLAIFGAVPGGAAGAGIGQSLKQAPGKHSRLARAQGRSSMHAEHGDSSLASTPFRFFSPNSFWNTPLPPKAQLDRRSHGIVSELTTLVNAEQLRKNGPWINASEDGAEIVTVGRNQPTVQVKLNHYPDSALSAAWSAVPLPRSAHVSPGDNDLAVWQPSTDRMWEFFEMRRRAHGWEAEWGGAMQHVSTNPGVYGTDAWPRAEKWWGVTASSLPYVGGAMTMSQLASGHIDHALAMAVPNVRRAAYTWPARRDDGKSADPNSIPEGARLRLDPKLNLASLNLPPLTRMMAEAAQRYGIMVRDYSPNIAFIAQDPNVGSEPLTKLYQGLYPNQLLASFPWRHLEVVKMHLHAG